MDNVTARMNAAALRTNTPVFVMIELTRRCNLNCDHCYVDHHIKDQLSVAQLEKIFADMARAGVLLITFTGGEVGLRKDLPEILAAARKHHFSVKLNSTGTLFSNDDIARLAELQVRQVNVSVYSENAEVHDRVVRKKGAFAETLRAVRAMRANGIAVKLQCPLMTSNASEIGGIIALARREGCTSTFDPVVSPMEDGRTDPCVLHLSAGQIASVYAQGGVIEFMGEGGGSEIGEERSPGDPVCGAGRTLAFIDSRGDLYPCLAWRERVGNVLEQSFDTLWRDSPAFHRVRGFTAGDLHECTSCSNQKYCNYCPGLSHAERGAAALAAPSACNAAEGKRLFHEHLALGETVTDPGFVGVGRYAPGHEPVRKRALLPILG
jgi:MoaA/NifB/PqqE/SkfB family radical SAM enzyme